ncbi:hypothetical protein [Blautia hansenii]|uniref:hypothetical protein n=1 Tax=Blautia hansenii TaxID=1322 RepID=UPI0022DEAF87|nr:hypothetical protein [Blautia hansenii]
MNTIELIATLKEMGKNAGKENIVGGIIDAIINYYNNKANFFEEDAIRVFKRFLKTGVLQFS